MGLDNGKRLLTLQEYAMAINSMAALDSVPNNQWGAFGDAGPYVCAVVTAPGSYRWMPGPEFSPRLYRGQPDWHDQCVPTLFRGLQRIEAEYWLCKIAQFGIFVSEHPAIRDFTNHTLLDEYRFDLNVEALAQHYEFKTRMLDFSRSRDVAMFFATNRQGADGVYSPVQQSTVYLYTVDLKELILNKKDAIPLGLEPLPRPFEQSAFGVRLGPDENLNDMQWVSWEAVKLQPGEAAHYNMMFHGGRTIFPSGAFERACRRVRLSQSIDVESVSRGARPDLVGRPVAVPDLVSELRGYGYKIENAVPRLSREDRRACSRSWERDRVKYLSATRGRLGAGHFNGS